MDHLLPWDEYQRNQNSINMPAGGLIDTSQQRN
jgi:hypothetical protein